MNILKTATWLLLAAPLTLYAQDANVFQRLQASGERLNTYNPSVDPTLRFKNVWVAPSNDDQTTVAVYMTLGTPVSARIEAVYCPIAQRVEFQEPRSDSTNALEHMRIMPFPISLQPISKLVLEPNGKRLVLIDIKQPLRVGDKVSCTFQLSSALYNNTTSAAITIEIPVQTPPAPPKKIEPGQRINPTPLPQPKRR